MSGFKLERRQIERMTREYIDTLEEKVKMYEEDLEEIAKETYDTHPYGGEEPTVAAEKAQQALEKGKKSD